MCRTCGCGADGETRLINLQTGKEMAMGDVHSHAHAHAHAHSHHHAHGSGHTHEHHHQHDHGHEHSHSSVVTLETEILAKNDSLAAHNRGWFAGREVLASTWSVHPAPARPRCSNAPSPTSRAK